MMQPSLDRASDALDGFEFLTMAEAGEVGHWEILKTLNERARNSGVQELVEWGIPIQQRHFETVRQGSLKLASGEAPTEPPSPRRARCGRALPACVRRREAVAPAAAGVLALARH